MTALHELYEQTRQSPWVDDLKRSYVDRGGLDDLIVKGIRGVTSNPTIMANAIASTTDYDDQFRELVLGGSTVEEAYWELVIYDILGALEQLRPLYDSSNAEDGYVSLEVAPSLARDTQATIASARLLHKRIARPNLMVKIPATKEGISAIEEMIAEGHSINVTLIFSLGRYAEVVEAYIRGIERLVDRGGDPGKVASVASFFVSRVDTEIDRRIRSDSKLAGQAALAQARLAYRYFENSFSSARFRSLAEIGARPQRPLWASTSTKNPAYPDLLYVEGLIAPQTVNTLPIATMNAFIDHGIPRRSIIDGYAADEETLESLRSEGVDFKEVTDLLEEQGLSSFSSSFDDLLVKMEVKAAQLRGRS